MKLNPDKEYVEKIRQALYDNHNYCPCVILQNEDTQCPCKEMRENNHCCCGLYIED